jgi:hypothetical protein
MGFRFAMTPAYPSTALMGNGKRGVNLRLEPSLSPSILPP